DRRAQAADGAGHDVPDDGHRNTGARPLAEHEPARAARGGGLAAHHVAVAVAVDVARVLRHLGPAVGGGLPLAKGAGGRRVAAGRGGAESARLAGEDEGVADEVVRTGERGIRVRRGHDDVVILVAVEIAGRGDRGSEIVALLRHYGPARVAGYLAERAA